MFHTLTILPVALMCIFFTLRSFAAEQTEPPKCDPAGVCTEGTNQTFVTGGKHIWANTRLFSDVPLPEVQKWLTAKPELEGKFVVIEFWRTWCGACKRMTPLMNTLQKKYGSDLAVIGITGETEEAVKAYAGPKKEYFLALDQPQPAKDKTETTAKQPEVKDASSAGSDWPDQTEGQAKSRPGQGLYEASFGVWGWPHIVILEPLHRTVVWEGFSGLKGHELTEAKVAKMLAIGRAMKEEAAKKK